MLIVEDEELRKIECIINEKMKWIICTRCDRAVPPEYLQTHLWTKHKIDCSDDMLNSIITGRELMTLDSIKAWKKNTVALEAAIDGIAVETGSQVHRMRALHPQMGIDDGSFRETSRG